MAKTATTNTAHISFRMDRDVKQQAETICANIGMNLTTAFTVFARQLIYQGKFPTEIYAYPLDTLEAMAEVNEMFANGIEKYPSYKSAAELRRAIMAEADNV